MLQIIAMPPSKEANQEANRQLAKWPHHTVIISSSSLLTLFCMPQSAHPYY